MARTTQYGRLDGIVIEFAEIEDGFEVAIAEYPIPYRDGSLLEDMGQSARQVKARCYFYGAGYEDHFGFVEHLKERELFDFFHPIYGLLQGKIKSITVRHDDSEDAAEVDFIFIENFRGDLQPQWRPDPQASTEEHAQNGFDEQQTVLSDSVSGGAQALKIPAPDVKAMLSTPVVAGTPILDQISGLGNGARAFVKQIDGYVAQFDALMTQATNPANSLLATISWAQDLPGTVIGSITRGVERYARAQDALAELPSQFLANLDRELNALATSIQDLPAKPGSTEAVVRDLIVDQVRIALSQRLALEAGSIYRQDEARRCEVKAAEEAASFDAGGNYVRTAVPDPLMTVGDLEQTLALVRTRLNAALSISRGLGELKEQARVLLEHVNTIKLERQKIVQVVLDTPTPLHLVCLANGLSYQAADRILAINRISRPNFCEGTVNVYAR